MMRRALVIALGIVTLAGPGHAAPADSDALIRAKAHFAQGKAFLEDKEYDQAIAELSAGKALASFPELVFDLAEAYRLAHRRDEALATYAEYLAAEPTGAMADEARTHVRELTTGTLSADQQAEAALQRQEAAYELDHEEHMELAHKRNLGHLELAIGAALAVVGVGVFALGPRAPGVAIGGGLAIAGGCTLVVGTITTLRGSDPNPVLPPPTRAATVSWAWSF